MGELNSPNRIVTLRGERGWSQEELAQAAGVSARTIQRLESGTPPAPETAKAVASAFDLVPADIFLNEQDARCERSAHDRGFRWGVAGAVAGYLCAATAILYNLSAGYSSGRDAGLALGFLGAATGMTCGLIGHLANRAKRAA